ncbi:hypothetical protein [Craterilacuibacter sinensis]|uniref:Uncharacterized protein n=1 Tax=Craterilacuibacter sinensis TaxID=2686017 RepID=A0A845BLM8_9NEIS|nr:hypothetical protein [Craterilacuibacter sinensis]MXR36128.1 hypothetical protein [Craterilacuibacter sinensis]
MKKSLIEYVHVLAVIFPLTLFIPRWMAPLLQGWQLDPAMPAAILLIDSVIVACAVFVLLPTLHKVTGRLFG